MLSDHETAIIRGLWIKNLTGTIADQRLARLCRTLRDTWSFVSYILCSCAMLAGQALVQARNVYSSLICRLYRRLHVFRISGTSSRHYKYCIWGMHERGCVVTDPWVSAFGLPWTELDGLGSRTLRALAASTPTPLQRSARALPKVKCVPSVSLDPLWLFSMLLDFQPL